MAQTRLGALLATLLLATSIAPVVANAQPQPDAQTRAEALYLAARKLMEEGRYVEACPKLAESQRLDPGGGTVLALALCHEAEGKTATAWTELRDALAAAVQGQRKDREQFIRDHLQELEPKLSTLAIDVDRALADFAGARVLRDGLVVARPEWGLPVPIDPGEHVVSVDAPGRAPWSRAISVKSGDHPVIAVAVPAALAPSPTPPAASSSASVETAPPAPVDAGDHRALLYSGAAISVIGLTIGTMYGLRAASVWSSAKSACPEHACADPAGVQKADDAKTAGYVSTAGFAIGLAGAGLVAYALLSDRPSSTAIRVAPAVGSRGGGIALGGAW